MSVLKGNLINATTKQSLDPKFDKTALFIGSDGQGNARIDSAISGAYSLPYLSAASLAQTGPINNIIYKNAIINQTFFEFRLAANNSILNALVPFLIGMNWTLVGALYETTIFGYITEQLTQIYQNNNSTPYFACKTYFGTVGSGSGLSDPDSAKEFCECLEISYDKVNVVVMFSALNSAVNIARVIEKACGNPGYTYIVTADDYLNPVTDPIKSQNPLNNGFLIRTYYDWNIMDYFKLCYDTLDETSLTYVAQELESYFSDNFHCVLSFDNPGNLEVCPDSIEDRTYECACPETSATTDQTILPELFFTVDSISAVGNALSLIQNNCTYINERSATYLPNVPIEDFCALSYFTPAILNYALRLVNFTGYTAQISFPPSSRSRLNQQYFYYQINDQLNNLTYLGNFTFAGLQINFSAITFANGVPVSEIVVDNPNLSDAVVAVFFGISVVIVAAFSVIFAILIFNYNNRILRSRSPLVTIIMCFGLLLGAIGWLLMSLGATDALCWIIILVDSIGFSFLIGGLIAKNFRIYRIFSNNRSEALNLETWRLCSFIGILTLFFLLLTLFVFLNGYGAIVEVSPDNSFYIFVSCTTDYDFWNSLYSITSMTCRVLLLLLACWLSWLTRKVHSVYNESKELAIISYAFLMTDILLLPIYYILEDSTNSETLKYVVRVEQLLIVEMLGLCVYFIPLLFKMFRK